MIVALKTDAPEAVIMLAKSSGEIVRTHTWLAHRTLARDLLAVMEAQLHEHGTDIGSVSGLVYYKGPGSFTGLRIGASVANTIAYANSVPIVGSGGEEWLEEGLARLRHGEDDRLVLPEYGREANITQPRK